jgi:hypothetical protein
MDERRNRASLEAVSKSSKGYQKTSENDKTFKQMNINLRENFAWLRHFTLSLLKQAAGRESVAMMRRSYGWDDKVLLKVLTAERT